MSAGVVNSRYEATVQLRLKGPGGIQTDVEAVVDTGFTGSLTLPIKTAVALGLERQSGGRAALADGSTWHFDLYAVEVDWDGAWRFVLVSAIGNEALIGMRLLMGHHLRIDVVPGGVVGISPLSA